MAMRSNWSTREAAVVMPDVAGAEDENGSEVHAEEEEEEDIDVTEDVGADEGAAAVVEGEGSANRSARFAVGVLGSGVVKLGVVGVVPSSPFLTSGESRIRFRTRSMVAGGVLVGVVAD